MGSKDGKYWYSVRGADRLWYDGAPDCATTWDRFKCAFLEAFPTSTNEGDVHAELMRRKKRKEETYEEYFYENVAIAKKVEISDQTDMMRSLSLQLHNSSIELLRRIKNYEDRMVQEPCRSNQRLDKTANHRKAGHTGYMGKKRCYNCNELGHISTQCPKLQKIKKCYSCNQLGHVAGLGSIRVKTLGSFKSVIEINESHFLTKGHVVSNDALAMPLILGQSLLTQARMTVDVGLLVELKEKSDDIQNLQEEEEKTEDLEFDILSFFHVPLEPESQKYTSFVTPDAQYEFLKVLFGMCKQVPSFLKLSGYFRKFIERYSLIAKPLSDMLKSGAAFVFGQKQEMAFSKLKTILVERPVLGIYHPEAETELHTDACKYGYGAALMQKRGDELYGKQEGMLNPIDKADLPLQTFHLDHLGPLITTKKGYKYILVVIDGFTKFTWIYPKKTLATEEVVSPYKTTAAKHHDRYDVQFSTQSKFKSKFLGPYKTTAAKHHDRYDVERVGTTEGPPFTSTAVDYMKPWSMSLESDSDSESDIEERDSPRSNSQDIPNPVSNPPRPDDAMGFSNESKVRNSRDVGTDQSRPPTRCQLRRRPTGNSRSLHRDVLNLV
ncbi:Zinc knuckle [Popillia japonica]|uniref:Zinc knuckle n=1 Tax=Popillia japonica TaxID=7064 RepID=A0AAW1KEQ8_POPJA